MYILNLITFEELPLVKVASNLNEKSSFTYKIENFEYHYPTWHNFYVLIVRPVLRFKSQNLLKKILLQFFKLNMQLSIFSLNLHDFMFFLRQII